MKNKHFNYRVHNFLNIYLLEKFSLALVFRYNMFCYGIFYFEIFLFSFHYRKYMRTY